MTPIGPPPLWAQGPLSFPLQFNIAFIIYLYVSRYFNMVLYSEFSNTGYHLAFWKFLSSEVSILHFQLNHFVVLTFVEHKINFSHPTQGTPLSFFLSFFDFYYWNTSYHLTKSWWYVLIIEINLSFTFCSGRRWPPGIDLSIFFVSERSNLPLGVMCRYHLTYLEVHDKEYIIMIIYI